MKNVDIVRRRPNHPLTRTLALGLGGLLAIYLVGRGIAEFFTVHYADPASYRNDWGGPSLAGVFAAMHGFAMLEVSRGFQWSADPDESFDWMIRFIDRGLRN